MNEKETEVYVFLVGHPGCTKAEISESTKVTTQTVAKYIGLLEAKGKITWKYGKKMYYVVGEG